MTLLGLQRSVGFADPSGFVLRTRIDDCEGTSRYADMVWQLEPAERMRNRPNLSLHFETVPVRFRSTMKEFCLAMLLGENQPTGRRFAIATIRDAFGKALRFVSFLDSKQIRSLATVPDAVLAEYVGFSAEAPGDRGEHLRAVRLLWQFGESLTDPLPADPALLPFWDSSQGRPTGDDTLTERIPEEVFKPLLSWASIVICTLSRDIMTARTERTATQHLAGGRHPTTPIPVKRGDHTRRVSALLDDYEQSLRRLPAHAADSPWPGTVNYVALDREAGVASGTTGRNFRKRVQSLAVRNGVEDNTYLRMTPTGLVGGQLWTERIAYGEVPELVRALQTACWIAVAGFSGMRDSEVKHIKRGCVRLDQDTTGRLSFHTLTAQAWKGNDQPGGVQATWVVAPIVADAVAILERLQPPKESQLFQPLPGLHVHESRIISKKIMKSRETNDALEHFIGWVNARFQASPGSLPIPDVEGRPWALRTRQFRKTLAWFIARRPGGIAAGAMQYKHLSLQMFRGYAGSSDSGFATEVAAETALARGEWIGAFVQESADVTGPSADEVRRRLHEKGVAVSFAGKLPENPAQMRSLLRRHDPHVYRGVAVICAFDPLRALCRRKKPSADNLNDCQPLKCANAAFTPEDIQTWRSHAEDLSSAGRNGAIAPAVQGHALRLAMAITAYFDNLERAV